jgi:hypothetical protein
MWRTTCTHCLRPYSQLTMWLQSLAYPPTLPDALCLPGHSSLLSGADEWLGVTALPLPAPQGNRNLVLGHRGGIDGLEQSAIHSLHGPYREHKG